MSRQYAETQETASRLHHVTRLVYSGPEEDLTSVEIDGVAYQPTNLKQYQVRLEEAANYGHKISMIIGGTNEITRLIIIPMVEPTRSSPRHRVRR
jgi:hypothetical protein